MSDCIEVDGKKYVEEGYLRASNAAVVRRDETIAALEAEKARLNAIQSMLLTVVRWHADRYYAACNEKPRFKIGDDLLTAAEERDAKLLSALRDREAALVAFAEKQPCKCPILPKCPHCGGDIAEGHDQFQGVWVCGPCIRTVQPLKDSSRPCPRCDILANSAQSAEEWRKRVEKEAVDHFLTEIFHQEIGDIADTDKFRENLIAAYRKFKPGDAYTWEVTLGEAILYWEGQATKPLGPLALPYAHSVLREIDAALANERAAGREGGSSDEHAD